MPVLSTALTALAVAGAAAGGVGAVVSYQGQQKAIAAQEKQDEVRKGAMELDANRRRRDIVRQTAYAQSTALSQATVQGAGGAGGSVLPGSQAQIANMGTSNLQGVNIAQQQGEAMFGLQGQVQAGYRQAALGGTISSIGASATQLAGSLTSLPVKGSSGAYSGPQRPITLMGPNGAYQW